MKYEAIPTQKEMHGGETKAGAEGVISGKKWV